MRIKQDFDFCRRAVRGWSRRLRAIGWIPARSEILEIQFEQFYGPFSLMATVKRSDISDGELVFILLE